VVEGEAPERSPIFAESVAASGLSMGKADSPPELRPGAFKREWDWDWSTVFTGGGSGAAARRRIGPKRDNRGKHNFALLSLLVRSGAAPYQKTL
jgi:hypothetical protein